MLSFVLVPLEVLGLGTVISFGIAVLIKVMLDAIRFFSAKSEKE